MNKPGNVVDVSNVEQSTRAPFISIITPFFNSEEYLEETIRCVLGQQFTDWELILVDDGSSDRSTAIAKTFAQRFPNKIFYCEHDEHANKAAAASRNLGVRRARGEYVALLDADDLWLPPYLTEQVAILRRYNGEISLLCEATRYWYSWDYPSNNRNNSNKEGNPQTTPAAEDVTVSVGAAADQLYPAPQLATQLYPLGAGAAPCVSSLLIKKSALTAIECFEESFVGKYQVFEDQALLIKIYLQESVYISSNCNNLYRQRPGSVMYMTKMDGLHHEARYYFLQWLDNYLKEKRITNRAIHKLLKKSLRAYHHPTVERIVNSLKYRYKLITKKITENQ